MEADELEGEREVAVSYLLFVLVPVRVPWPRPLGAPAALLQRPCHLEVDGLQRPVTLLHKCAKWLSTRSSAADEGSHAVAVASMSVRAEEGTPYPVAEGRPATCRDCELPTVHQQQQQQQQRKLHPQLAASLMDVSTVAALSLCCIEHASSLPPIVGAMVAACG